MRISNWSSDVCSSDLVNLDLRRWLNRTPPATRIDVNTAAATLDYWHGGIPVDHRRVVVGQPDWETPQLSSAIFRLVANPTWTVPKSIERSEMAAKGANYLRRRSEEHTSELQSLMRISYAVFCLKKKTNNHNKQLRNIIQ